MPTICVVGNESISHDAVFGLHVLTKSESVINENKVTVRNKDENKEINSLTTSAIGFNCESSTVYDASKLNNKKNDS